MRPRQLSSVRAPLVATALLCAAALVRVAAPQELPPDPPAPVEDPAGNGADAPAADAAGAADAAVAAPTPAAALPAAHDALTRFVADFESGATERALVFAEGLESELARTDGDEAVRASRRAWRAQDRALLAYGAGLAGAELVSEMLALATPDEAAVLAREDAALARFAFAAGEAGPGELRDRALAAPGALLAARGERQVLAAQSQAMLTRSEIPFGAQTPEREALLAARTTLEEARAALVTRLVHDWRDADVRANLEWVARRLAEIERILERADQQEQEREEQQDQQDQQQGQDGDQQQDGQQDEQEQQDGEQQGEENGEPQAGDDSEPQQPDEGESDPSQPQDGESGEAPQDEQGAAPQDTESGERETSAPSGEEAAPEGSSPREAPQVPATFGDVEVQRLLNRLSEIERAGEETRRRLRATQRRRVEKDW
jgi:Ca-activated chloride channel family protein